MPLKPLPFSLKKLRRKVDKLDAFVKSITLQVIKKDMSPADLGFPTMVVDELAHLHGLIDLAKCCVKEIEIFRDEFPELEKSLKRLFQ